MADSNSIFQDLLAARNLFSTHVYTGPVRAASERLGLHSLLRSVEKGVTKQLPGPNVSIDAGETSCTFYNDSLEEYRWFSMYPETDGGMPVLDEIIDAIEPDDSFWDVGGNIGIYSCFAATEIESGSVTVEPHPKNVDRIRTNLDRNDLDGEVHQIALASECGEVTHYWYFTTEKYASNSSNRQLRLRECSVRVRKLDTGRAPTTTRGPGDGA